MKLNTIGIIIRREYLNRVKKKSFLITTFVVPVLMAALFIVPIVLMMNSKDKAKTIAVVDRSGVVAEALTNTETIVFMNFGDFSVDSLKSHLKDMNIDGVLSISEFSEDKSLSVDLTSLKPFGMETTELISGKVNGAIEDYKMSSYDIPDLEKIMKDVKQKVKVNAFVIDEDGNESASELGINQVISMLMGIIIFLFITLFGGMVMSAVIEEKTSRVVEVLVSSVKATELMFGKIIGIAFVAFTQFFLWVILTLILVSVAGSVIGLDKIGGVDTSSMMETSSMLGANPELEGVVGTLSSIPVGEYLCVFLVFFLFGYILYSTLFAAIGSSVDNEGDAQQLQLPVTIPLMIGYFIAIYTFKAPDSGLAFWGSMIPFTSPIVMLARLPFGVETWEILLSVSVLVVTAFICAWLSAKIYKVGILMFGKKTNWKDLLKWLKQN